MSEAGDFKRLTAFRTDIKSIISANFVKASEQQSPDYLEFKNLRVSRVRIIATVVSKKVNEDGSYAYLVLDDGTETIRVKSWKEDVVKLEKPLTGDIIELVGRVKEWESERYLTCEIIKVINDPNHWLYHNFELLLSGEKVERIEEKKETGMSTGVEAKRTDSESGEDLILKIIKENDIGKGTSLALITKSSKLPDKRVEEVLKNLLIDGLIYEPSKHNYKILDV